MVRSRWMGLDVVGEAGHSPQALLIAKLSGPLRNGSAQVPVETEAESWGQGLGQNHPDHQVHKQGFFLSNRHSTLPVETRTPTLFWVSSSHLSLLDVILCTVCVFTVSLQLKHKPVHCLEVLEQSLAPSRC